MALQPASAGSVSGGKKSKNAFRTISEVADLLDVPAHVLRFWESKFSHIKPLKRGGNRRYYRPEDVALLKAIQYLLYTDGYTIRGVQKQLREHGVRATIDGVMSGDAGAEAPEAAAKESNGASAQAAMRQGDGSDLKGIVEELKKIRVLLNNPHGPQD